MNELGAAIVLTLGAVHVEACVPLLIQCATARPDAPAALLVLGYTQTIIGMLSHFPLPPRSSTESHCTVASVDKVCATRRALTTRRAAVVQAIREMEVASGRNGKSVARCESTSYTRCTPNHGSTRSGSVCASVPFHCLVLHCLLRCGVHALQHVHFHPDALLCLSACYCC